MKKALLLVLCLGLLGAGAQLWRSGPSDELANRLFHHEIPSTQYCVVNDAQLSIAIEKLQKYAAVKLSKNEADNFIQPCKIESKRFFYLVRALDVSSRSRFAVYGYRGRIYVTSGVLGTSASPRRTALVLTTQFAVSHVYVNYFVAQ